MAKPVAIVTGAGRGIGRATAIQLAERAYDVVAVSRTREELDETIRLCKGGFAVVADVGKAQGVDLVVKQAMDRFARVDAVVHAAGVVFMLPIEKITLAQWEETIDTNLSAVVHFAKALWPIWRQQRGGVMVNVSSYASRDPFKGLGAYGAAKAGINLLGISLSREGAEIGVRVHTVAPAATDTKMLRSLDLNVPENVMLKPADVARVIVQCVCGDLACTSGEVIFVHR